MTPQRLSEIEDNREDRRESIRPALTYVINHDTFSIPLHLEQILFYAEVIYARDHGERLTNAEYVTNTRGVYSEGIHDTLDHLRDTGAAEYTRTLYKQERSIRYKTAEYSGELSDEQETFLDSVIEEVNEFSIDQLVEWVTDTSLYQNTAYGTPIPITSVANDE